jgi:hypothetical protein
LCNVLCTSERVSLVAKLASHHHSVAGLMGLQILHEAQCHLQTVTRWVVNHIAGLHMVKLQLTAHTLALRRKAPKATNML